MEDELEEAAEEDGQANDDMGGELRPPEQKAIFTNLANNANQPEFEYGFKVRHTALHKPWCSCFLFLSISLSLALFFLSLALFMDSVSLCFINAF